jgi:hypothetical protein
MFQRIAAPALCLVFWGVHASADAVQILDHKTESCIDESLQSIKLPNSRTDYTSEYGVVSKEAKINTRYIVSANIHTKKLYGGAMEHSFNAKVKYVQPDGYVHVSAQSIEASFNKNGKLTKVDEKDLRQEWNVSEMAPHRRSFKDPEYSEVQTDAIQNWIANTSQTLALVGIHCLTDGFYEPPLGKIFEPPDFSKLKVLALKQP